MGRVGLRRLVRAVALATCCCSVARVGAAQGAAPPDPRQAQPERPTVATHAFTVAPGYIEVEAGFQRTPLGDSASLLTTPVLFKVGLTRRLQLDVAPTWVRVSSGDTARSGIGDTTLGVKWRVLDDAPLVGAFALQATATLPTGAYDRSTGTGTTGANLLLISSHDIHGVELDINVGYTGRTGGGLHAPKNATVWTVSSGIPLSGSVGWALEVFGYPGTSGPASSGPSVGLLLGPTWTVNRSLVLDTGAILNLEGLVGTQVYAGLTWNIGRAW